MIKVYLILVVTCLPSSFTLAIRDWGDNCTHSDECYDHRMVCVPDEENVTRCFCDRFHKWNGSSVGCVQMYSAAYIMNQTVKVHDNAGRIDRMQDHMFIGPIYSVFFMIFMIATCTLSVVIYCIYIRKKDHNLRTIVAQLMSENNTNRQSGLESQRSALERQRSVLESQQSTSRC